MDNKDFLIFLDSLLKKCFSLEQQIKKILEWYPYITISVSNLPIYQLKILTITFVFKKNTSFEFEHTFEFMYPEFNVCEIIKSYEIIAEYQSKKASTRNGEECVLATCSYSAFSL